MRVSLTGVVRSFGAHTVLDRVDLTLGPRSRLGLVGPNGAGKSTLLRLAAGLDEPDEGTVERTPASLTVGYLPQEHDRRPGETLLGYLARRTGTAEAEAEVKRHTADWSPDAYAAALERFLALGGGDLEARARTVCAELGLPVSLDQETATLSGGEAARAALAAILLSRFDLLLLDEPTNDLDFDGLDRLERFVDGFAGGLAVVSHDRAFLDRTVDRIAEIDPWTGGVREYAGGWSDYAAARERARAKQYAAFEDAQERTPRGRGAPARPPQPGTRRRRLPRPRDRRLRPAGDEGALRQGAPGGARARADRAGREAVRAVAAAPLAGGGAAARRPRRVARGRRRRPRRLPARAGRPRPRSGRARRDHGQQRERQVDAARAAARRAGAGCRDAASSAARPCSATLDQRRVAYDGDTAAPRRLHGPHRPPARRGAHAAREVQPRRRPRRAAVRDPLPGRADASAPRRADGRRRQPASSSTSPPTTSTSRRSRSSRPRSPRTTARWSSSRTTAAFWRPSRPPGRFRSSYTPQPLMAVPKKKTSKARRDKRRAQHGIEAPRVNVCPTCHQPKRPHRVCPTCKTYKGREIEPLRTPAP